MILPADIFRQIQVLAGRQMFHRHGDQAHIPSCCHRRIWAAAERGTVKRSMFQL